MASPLSNCTRPRLSATVSSGFCSDSATSNVNGVRCESHFFQRGMFIVSIILFLLFELIPFYWVLITAFKTTAQYTTFTSIFWPAPWSLEQFKVLFGPTRAFGLWYQNTVVVAVVSYFLLKDRPRQAKWLSPEERETLENALENERALTAGNGRHKALTGLLHPRVWLLAFAMFCTVTATYAVEAFMPTIIRDWYHMDIRKLTGLIILPPALALLSHPAAAWSSDHFV